jgi:1-acyl-sn-glycerol-3-phosphate acyltransferase
MATRGLSILVKTFFFYVLGVFWIGLIAYMLAIPPAIVERLLGRGESKLGLTVLYRYIWITSFFYRHVAEIEFDDEEIVPESGTVVVCNHHSFIDIFLLLHLFPRIHFSARRSLFRIPFLGWAMSLLGHFPHDPARPEIALEVAESWIDRGRFIGMFPEGTRSCGPTIGPFSSGAFRLAERTTGRIQPVVVAGTHRVWIKGQFWIRNLGPVRMRVLPLEKIPTGLERREFLARIEEIRAKMQKAHAELLERIPD